MGLLGPESLGAFFEFDATFDDLFQKCVVNVLCPQDPKQSLAVRVAGFGELVSELVENFQLGCNGKVLTGRAETNDKRAVMRDHGLIPFDLNFEVRECSGHPVDDIFQFGRIVLVGKSL